MKKKERFLLVRFIFFLLVNGALDSYTYYLSLSSISSYRELKRKLSPYDWMDSIFKWDKTVEGYSFWKNLCELWDCKLEEIYE